jgi:hypothetical protein
MMAIPLLALIMFVTTISIATLDEQVHVSYRDNSQAKVDLRQVIGLPSIAIGTSQGATRNPLLEVYCTSLYDLPGGYCYAIAATFVDTPMRDLTYARRVPCFNITACKVEQ